MLTAYQPTDRMLSCDSAIACAFTLSSAFVHSWEFF